MDDGIINFDAMASSDTRSEVVDVMLKYMDDICVHPNTLNSFGLKSKLIIQDSLNVIALSIGASDINEIFFTSGGTDGNHKAFELLTNIEDDYCILYSAIEHASVIYWIKKFCKKSVEIPVHSNGLINLTELENKLSQIKCKKIVSVQLVNSDIGVIQPISEVSSLVSKYDAKLVVDACAAWGRTKFKVSALGADIVTLSSWKVGGPRGIGILWQKGGRSDSNGTPWRTVHGGGVDIASVAGLAKAASIVSITFNKGTEKQKEVFARLISSLKNIDGLKVVADQNLASGIVGVVLPEDIPVSRFVSLLCNSCGIVIGYGNIDEFRNENSTVTKLGFSTFESKRFVKIVAPVCSLTCENISSQFQSCLNLSKISIL